MDVVGKSMQQHDDRAVGGSCFVVSDIEDAGVDLAKWLEPPRSGSARGLDRG
jgi:hypothetical protein